MRQRVSAKSPVRENRTPGSVRGLSGNWQSYRDLTELQERLHAIVLLKDNSGVFSEASIPQSLLQVFEPPYNLFLLRVSPVLNDPLAPHHHILHGCSRERKHNA